MRVEYQQQNNHDTHNRMTGQLFGHGRGFSLLLEATAFSRLIRPRNTTRNKDV